MERAWGATVINSSESQGGPSSPACLVSGSSCSAPCGQNGLLGCVDRPCRHRTSSLSVQTAGFHTAQSSPEHLTAWTLDIIPIFIAAGLNLRRAPPHPSRRFCEGVGDQPQEAASAQRGRVSPRQSGAQVQLLPEPWEGPVLPSSLASREGRETSQSSSHCSKTRIFPPQVKPSMQHELERRPSGS